jgi:transposase
MNGCLPPVSQQQEQKKKVNEKRKLNHLGINVGKRICRIALKDDKGKILDEFFFGNNSQGILELIKRTQNYRTKKCNAVLESTGNMWMRIHYTLEDNGIDTILANPYKTKIIAQAKIKSQFLKILQKLGL